MYIYNIYIYVIYVPYPSFSHLISVLLMSLLISVTSEWCPQERPWEWWHRVKNEAHPQCVYANARRPEKVEGARIPLTVIKLQYHWGNCDVEGQVTWVLWQTDICYLVQAYREDSDGGGDGMEITLYEKQDLGCMELLYGMDDNLVDSIRVRIKEKANNGDTVLELC